jgi:NAD(P)-dependent dehydrogenase (short-subunit alcohol dehydrogenase family)
VVQVASDVHRAARGDWEAVFRRFGYGAFEAYARSKLANVLYAVELAERLEGSGVTVNTIHPGVIATKLLRAGVSRGGDRVESGAERLVFMALSPSLGKTSGAYFSEDRQHQLTGVAARLGEAQRLRDVSELMSAVASPRAPLSCVHGA